MNDGIRGEPPVEAATDPVGSETGEPSGAPSEPGAEGDGTAERGAEPAPTTDPAPSAAHPAESVPRVEAYFSATEAEGADFTGRVAVVIDVIRATTVIVEALASGARAIYPVVSTEDAIRLSHTLGRDDTLLCGERKGLKVDGFHLGNSPREFTPERVGGKRLVMSTTNGTRALWAAQGAERVLVLSFLNLRAVALEVAEALGAGTSLALVCAGKEGRFSLDDAFCAGLLVREVALVLGESGPGSLDLNDQARAALCLADAFELSEGFLRHTAAGAALVGVGLAEDLAFCARKNRYTHVPRMEDRILRLPGSSSTVASPARG
jgi:2-phosphosulfolactate phosphatase